MQAGNVYDHHVADLLPAHQDDQTPIAGGGVQSQQRLAHQTQYAVQKDLPDIAQHDAADEVGHEENRAEWGGALDAACQQKGNAQRDNVDEHGGHHGEGSGKAEGVCELLVLKRLDIVAQTHERGFVDGGELAQGQIQTLNKRDHKADEKGSQRRQQENGPVSADVLLHKRVPPYRFC